MKAQSAMEHNQSGQPLKVVPSQSATPAEPPPESAPALTATRAGQLLPGQEYAPVIRLKPSTEQHGQQPPGAGTSTAEVIDIESAEVRRRVAAISRSIAQASLEVLAGTRPATQLSRWLDPASYERIQLRSKMIREQRERRRHVNGSKAARLHRSPQVRSVRLCRISSKVYEATIVVVEQARVRAVALRLEYRKDLWKVTAMEIG